MNRYRVVVEGLADGEIIAFYVKAENPKMAFAYVKSKMDKVPGTWHIHPADLSIRDYQTGEK